MWSLENFESSPQNKISPFNRQNLVFSLQRKKQLLNNVCATSKINMLFTKILKNYHYHFLGKITRVPKCTNYQHISLFYSLHLLKAPEFFALDHAF